VILCLACASLFEPGKDEKLRCPDCGTLVARDRYERLRRYPDRITRFGFQYRALYQEELDAGVLESRAFVLPLHEVFTFVALAILSGVVGNAAYAAVEAAIKRIRSHAGNTELVPAAEVRLLNAELDQLRNYVTEMATNPGAIDREVLAAVLD